ncbi:hypothetical protein HZS_169 [Henneguya salminicola]|nr:hypothetical protein HZS_169 [Henneguya salminicola]
MKQSLDILKNIYDIISLAPLSEKSDFNYHSFRFIFNQEFRPEYSNITNYRAYQMSLMAENNFTPNFYVLGPYKR